MSFSKVTVNGAHVAVHTSKGESDVGIFFVHDAMLDSRMFKLILSSPLGNQIRMAAIDLPGHGSSGYAENPKDYQLDNLAEIVAGVASQLNMETAFFVGAGVGAHVVLAASSILKRSRGFMFVNAVPVNSSDPDLFAKVVPFNLHEAWQQPTMDRSSAAQMLRTMTAQKNPPAWLIDALVQSDGQFRASLLASMKARRWVNGVDALGKLNSRGVPYAFLKGALGDVQHMVLGLNVRLPGLWRHSVQLIPCSGDLVTLEEPEPFTALLRSFFKDSVGDAALSPTKSASRRTSSSSIDSRRSSGQQSPRKVSHPGGSMPHVRSRYEAVVEEGPRKSLPNSPVSVNARGRVEPGTMPHVGSRFEMPVQQAPRSNSKGQLARRRSSEELAASNPNLRGRQIPGTMPHPGARFEAEVPSPKRVQDSPKARENPHNRGRAHSGQMPHPGARFESPVKASPTRVQRNSLEGNPHARGRATGGVMPHPAARFELGPAAINDAHTHHHHTEVHSQEYHTNSHNSSSTSIKVQQPPGGHTSIRTTEEN